MKNKKIIIFGSSGFLGSHLVNALYQNNDVIQFDINSPELEYEGTTFLKGSILDKTLVQKAIKNVDIVYHFAAMTDIDYVNNNPAEAIEINIAGTSNILDACITQKVERLVLMLQSAMAANGQVGLMMNVPKNKLDEVMEILPEGKKPTIAELTDSNWMDLTVILEEQLVREIAPDLKAIGVEDIVEYSINKIIH